jgi:N-hydroxyarylamine O-acetyltransferase
MDMAVGDTQPVQGEIRLRSVPLWDRISERKDAININNLNMLFRERIHYSKANPIAFQDLETILEAMSKHIPFENICIIEKRSQAITKGNLVDKMLVKNEGGLCYELNGLLYLFLIENGCEAALVRGSVYDGASGMYQSMGKTHVAILVRFENQAYIIDGGFGGNIPLKPVPLSGEVISSKNGEFRMREVKTPHGEYILEMKLKHKHSEWKIGYAFDPEETIKDVSMLDEVRVIIEEHDDSPFNKHPLLTKRTDNGGVTLTDTAITQWKGGRVTKREIDAEGYKDFLDTWFCTRQHQKDPE